MIISLIAAIAKQRVIGIKQQLPWQLPADLAWFKKQTLHKPVIMGKKTFLSIGRALPHRTNIVLSHHPMTSDDTNVVWVTSLEAALSVAKSQQAEEVMIIGGGMLYQQALPLADKLYLTHIDADIAGDTYFPDYQPDNWQVNYSESHPIDERHRYPFRFEILTRRT